MQLKNISDFKSAIGHYGNDKFWELYINAYLSRIRPDLNIASKEIDIDTNTDTFSFDKIGDLYEIALEHNNQISKKELGQYFTPKDVCCFMAKKLLAGRKKNDHLADVCCGTGNLIIEVLSQLSKKEARQLIYDKKVHLYDLDEIAAKLAVMKIGILFAEKNNYNSYLNIAKSIDVVIGNFLSDNISLPDDCLVISNPPYGKLSNKIDLWEKCTTDNTKDLYAVFMEKIAQQAKRSVIISPQSFIGGKKFSAIIKPIENDLVKINRAGKTAADNLESIITAAKDRIRTIFGCGLSDIEEAPDFSDASSLENSTISSPDSYYSNFFWAE